MRHKKLFRRSAPPQDSGAFFVRIGQIIGVDTHDEMSLEPLLKGHEVLAMVLYWKGVIKHHLSGRRPQTRKRR